MADKAGASGNTIHADEQPPRRVEGRQKGKGVVGRKGRAGNGRRWKQLLLKHWVKIGLKSRSAWRCEWRWSRKKDEKTAEAVVELRRKKGRVKGKNFKNKSSNEPESNKTERRWDTLHYLIENWSPKPSQESFVMVSVILECDPVFLTLFSKTETLSLNASELNQLDNLWYESRCEVLMIYLFFKVKMV